jgi:glycosyltransferase involved in cell wall biosynthesis
MTNKKLMSVSIIIPIYNSSKYIGACIDSIFSQECEEADIECILVNDCTPDNSMEIVHNKLKDYRGRILFKTIHLDTNSGHCVARNAGIRISTGDYILFVDSDDILQPSTISYFIEGIKNNGGDNVDIVLGNSFDNQRKEEIMHLDTDVPYLIDNSDESALRKLLSRELFHTSWNKLVKRSFFTEQNLYFQGGIINEDQLWSYLLFRQIRNVLIMPNITYIYNKDNPINITSNSVKSPKHLIESRIYIYNTILDNPPKFHNSQIDYFVWILTYLARTLDIFEANKQQVSDLYGNLHLLTNRFLKTIWKSKCYLFFFHSLILVKPFYYVTHIRLYRRYFDNITNIVVSLQKTMSP